MCLLKVVGPTPCDRHVQRKPLFTVIPSHSTPSPCLLALVYSKLHDPESLIKADFDVLCVKQLKKLSGEINSVRNEYLE